MRSLGPRLHTRSSSAAALHDGAARIRLEFALWLYGEPLRIELTSVLNWRGVKGRGGPERATEPAGVVETTNLPEVRERLVREAEASLERGWGLDVSAGAKGPLAGSGVCEGDIKATFLSWVVARVNCG